MKHIIYGLMVILMMVSALGALDDGLFSYVKFENSTLVDEFGYANEWGTLYDPLYVPGKLGNAVNIQTNYEQVVYGGPEAFGADDIYETQLKHNGGTWNIWFNIREFAGDPEWAPNNAARLMGGTQEDWNGCNVQADGINMYFSQIDLPTTALNVWLPDYTAPQTYSPSTSALLTAPTQFQEDTWYMATLTYDEISHEAKLYINGVEVDSALFTPSEFGKDVYCSWAFGNGPNNGYGLEGNNYAFPGMIDAFKAWGRPLNGTEVLAVFTAENAGIDTPYLPPCTPEWECSGYSEVCVMFKADCDAVIDANECGETYTGNYSEFPQGTCGTTSDSTGAAHQQVITPKTAQSPSQEGSTAFSIAGGEKFNFFAWIDSIILKIRQAVGLQ